MTSSIINEGLLLFFPLCLCQSLGGHHRLVMEFNRQDFVCYAFDFTPIAKAKTTQYANKTEHSQRETIQRLIDTFFRTRLTQNLLYELNGIQ